MDIHFQKMWIHHHRTPQTNKTDLMRGRWLTFQDSVRDSCRRPSPWCNSCSSWPPWTPALSIPCTPSSPLSSKCTRRQERTPRSFWKADRGTFTCLFRWAHVFKQRPVDLHDLTHKLAVAFGKTRNSKYLVLGEINNFRFLHINRSTRLLW